MNDESPSLNQLLARLCGGAIDDKDYVGYFMNEHGEELVFAQRRGEKTARFWHSDMDWNLLQVDDHSIRVGGIVEGVTTVGDMIIDRAEATWLSTCLAVSRHLRPGRA
ncbi:hypothetical protein ACMA1D_10125 [Streptomyces sp. 796.1]|uniref:hypothetical protein n=1 Tax=Streptomyces sp. 796.1 TaxID=3163029 RepID=UPI0039C9E1B3